MHQIKYAPSLAQVAALAMNSATQSSRRISVALSKTMASRPAFLMLNAIQADAQTQQGNVPARRTMVLYVWRVRNASLALAPGACVAANKTMGSGPAVPMPNANQADASTQPGNVKPRKGASQAVPPARSANLVVAEFSGASARIILVGVVQLTCNLWFEADLVLNSFVTS